MPGLPQNVSVLDDDMDLDYGDEGRRQFLGFTLDKESKEFTWHARTCQDQDTEYDDSFVQYLIITNAVLGSGCKDGKHIVEVETAGMDDKSMKHTIIHLDSNNAQRMMSIALTKDSTFRLVEGEGPLAVSCVQVPEMTRIYGMDGQVSSDDEDEPLEEECDKEESEEGSPEEVKAKKRPAPGTGSKGKKAKMESVSGDDDMEQEDEDEEDEEEEEEEESPPKKIVKKKGAKGKGAAGPPGVGAAKIQAAKKAAAAKATANASARGKAAKAKK